MALKRSGRVISNVIWSGTIDSMVVPKYKVKKKKKAHEYV